MYVKSVFPYQCFAFIIWNSWAYAMWTIQSGLIICMILFGVLSFPALFLVLCKLELNVGLLCAPAVKLQLMLQIHDCHTGSRKKPIYCLKQQ